MTLLVTGATGHVGHEVVRQAARQGLPVLAVHRGDLDPDRAQAAGSGVTWLRCDLVDGEQVRRLAAAHAVDACIHAAAISNEAHARPAPLDAFAGNVGATANLLEAARQRGWRRFVFVSTGSVFQRDVDPARPILEDRPPSPINVYGTTKAMAEQLVRMYREVYAMSASAVRISWVFGPPLVTDSPTRGPVPSLLMRALRGEPIREGGGDFAASFTFVADVAEGLLAASRAAELRHEVYHLGSGVNFTAREVAAAVREAVPGAVIELAGGTEPWTRYTSPRGPLAGRRLRDDTGYAVRHSLAAAIAAYAAWMRERGAPSR